MEKTEGVRTKGPLELNLSFKALRDVDKIHKFIFQNCAEL